MEKKFEELYNKVIEKVSAELRAAYQAGELDEFAKKYGLQEDSISQAFDGRMASILVIGSERTRKKDLQMAAKKFNPELAKRIEFNLEYKRLQHSFNDLKMNAKYSDVIVGPDPHKVAGYDNFISTVKEEPELYPNLVEAKSGNGNLKLTKTSFIEALKKTKLYRELIADGGYM